MEHWEQHMGLKSLGGYTTKHGMHSHRPAVIFPVAAFNTLWPVLKVILLVDGDRGRCV